MSEDIYGGCLCGSQLGRWGELKQASKIGWVDEWDNPTNPPKTIPCGHPNHWQWGRGARNGQKLYYPPEQMYWQKWELTDEEFRKAVDNYDIMSLDVPPRFICEDCKNKLNNNHNDTNT